jgi:hypothetical protein
MIVKYPCGCEVDVSKSDFKRKTYPQACPKHFKDVPKKVVESIPEAESFTPSFVETKKERKRREKKDITEW